MFGELILFKASISIFNFTWYWNKSIIIDINISLHSRKESTTLKTLRCAEPKGDRRTPDNRYTISRRPFWFQEIQEYRLNTSVNGIRESNVYTSILGSVRHGNQAEANHCLSTCDSLSFSLFLRLNICRNRVS